MNHPYRIIHADEPDLSFTGKCALTIMAKAPVPGRVKTRLSPPLSPAQAAQLNACFLRDTVENLRQASQAAPSVCVISYTPVGAEAEFVGTLPPDSLLLPQRGDGFGERLLSTAEDLFACGFSAVCLIDSDSPTVPTGEFKRAVSRLLETGKRAILGPSRDGGYYLIGLQSPEPALFDRIDWSTSLVATQTRQRAWEIGLPLTLLQEWYDVDDASSLELLLREVGPSSSGTKAGYRATYTRDYLKELSLPSPGLPRKESCA